jgi:hypothetical protein
MYVHSLIQAICSVQICALLAVVEPRNYAAEYIQLSTLAIGRDLFYH